MSAIHTYFAAIRAVHATGQATEHSYRPALRDLFSSLDDKISVINEPKRVAVGAPDFIFERNGIPVGHCEAKDLDKDLKALKGYSVEQKQRYRKGFPNLVYTNGLDFEFYREGELIRSISIGDFLLGVQAKPEEFDALEAQLQDFVAQRPRTIHSSKKLAEMMAGKAALIKDMMGKALLIDLRDEPDSELAGQYEAFKQHLIHDITAADFADLYAETIAYGLFAARLHDDTLDTFSRTEALELLPKSNPFLRSLFGYIAGPELDDRIAWIIDDLAKIFLACDLKAIMADFGQLTGQNDPFLHFYETFLSAYNPAKRKARGVWYTPEPVVNFIVRAVDEVLKTEFGLADGLADTSKVTVDFETGQKATKKDGKTTLKSGVAATEKREVHRVQILDPATGTGTFLAEVIKLVGNRVKSVAPGLWSKYIEDDLVPRVHGFELLMASYAMCHLKLDMILQEMGYKPSGTPPRLSVYLTNSLEEGEYVEQTLFAQWLAKEAKAANTIKRDTPIMVVMGNPPYSGISQNMGAWISGLIAEYKYVDGVHFGERKHWLHDDYVKFIRFAEHMIEKNGEGVVGFITNHGYLDNPTFRGMRWHLLSTFDKIYVLDLHGNAKKHEVAPDGRPDKNVFDIQQGVAIIIAVKSRNEAQRNAQVYHGDLWGTRSAKYKALSGQGMSAPTVQPIECHGPQWAFVPRDDSLEGQYGKGFSVTDFMPVNGTGVVTARDGLVIDFAVAELTEKISRFADPEKSDAQIRTEFFPNKKAGKYDPGDSRGWKLPAARQSLQTDPWISSIEPVAYRPFDERVMLYRNDMVDWGRFDFLRHMRVAGNLGLMICRQSAVPSWCHAFVVGGLVDDSFISNRTKERGYCLPLYLFPKEGDLDQTRRINIAPKLLAKIKVKSAHPKFGEPDEVQIFDYIYGVLNHPGYRIAFSELLKFDFPRVPWPKTPDIFWSVSEKGAQLRRLHLMEPAAIGDTPYPFEGDGDGIVGKPTFNATKGSLGDVWINKTQRFTNVPEVSWNFYIGGYQPAQKWLKDRKGRALSYTDIQHYQRIIKILSETDRIMKEIELPLDLDGE
ncbi:type ISP restriction/modification enzyme [Maricaulis salignorans]|uniref:type ISP restriction/modification enzyme n=1 Tax=Maricaulis salignorans TaxID=144026 RepID=UPI003A91D729